MKDEELIREVARVERWRRTFTSLSIHPVFISKSKKLQGCPGQTSNIQ